MEILNFTNLLIIGSPVEFLIIDWKFILCGVCPNNENVNKKNK